MSKLKSFIKEKKIEKVFFDDLRLIKRFLDFCEETDDVIWNGGQRPLYELDNIRRLWQRQMFYEPSSMIYCEFYIDVWDDGTIRFMHCVDSFPTKTRYSDVLANPHYIDCEDLLLQLDTDLIILNKEDAK